MSRSRQVETMHDWTFLSVSVDWKAGTARLAFIPFGDGDEPKHIVATGLSDLRLPRKLPWGRSVSVNSSKGPILIDGGGYRLSIEMQTGDQIEIVAAQFEMPAI